MDDKIFKITIIFLVILGIGLYFYYNNIYPAQVRRECASKLAGLSFSFDKSTPDQRYQQCLSEHGLSK
ncbi:MAG: hypothetical protein WC470_01165 [Candidatus Paceibacterota bacterium]